MKRSLRRIIIHYKIPGYSYVSKRRKSTKRGGVGLYIQNVHSFITREDLSTFDEGTFKSVFVEIDNNKLGYTIVGVSPRFRY